MATANQIRSIYTTEQINYCLTISRFVTSSTQTESQARYSEKHCLMDPGNRTKGINRVLRYLSADPECVHISAVNTHYNSAPILYSLFYSMKSDVLLSLKCVCMCDGPWFIISRLNLEQWTSGCRLRFGIIGCGLIIRLNVWQHIVEQEHGRLQPLTVHPHAGLHIHPYSAPAAFLHFSSVLDNRL